MGGYLTPSEGIPGAVEVIVLAESEWNCLGCKGEWVLPTGRLPCLLCQRLLSCLVLELIHQAVTHRHPPLLTV